MDEAGSRARVDEGVRAAACLREPDRLVRVRECSSELTQLGQAPGQERARVDVLPDGEIAASQLALERRHVSTEQLGGAAVVPQPVVHLAEVDVRRLLEAGVVEGPDRKSTRLNSSHGYISYAVFCLKKKKNK